MYLYTLNKSSDNSYSIFYDSLAVYKKNKKIKLYLNTLQCNVSLYK